MVLNPAIIALLAGSFLLSLMVLYSGYWGFSILRRWDLRSGSDVQLGLEKRTYLISTILNYAFGFQLISLFLFIYTADALHHLFAGAMCAAGTLNVNKYGYPLLVLKIINFLLAGLWLILNYADTRAHDYPLIKKKYALLLLIAPLIFSEGLLQIVYFIGLRADVITSCCGSLFDAGRSTISSDLAALPPFPLMTALYLSLSLTVGSGVLFAYKGRGGALFSLLSGSSFFIGIASIISFISVYIYELPTHHCPFCILQQEYDYVGYFLYLSLFGGGISGMGVGMLAPFRLVPSLAKFLPVIRKGLAMASLFFYGAFILVVTYIILSSSLSLANSSVLLTY